MSTVFETERLQQMYQERRAAVLREMAQKGDAVAFFPAAPVHIRNNDVEHEFRQDSDLHYLTGFNEPESALLLRSVEGKATSTVFLRERDPERETWDGRRLGVARAPDSLGVDEAYPIDELPKRLVGILTGASRVYYRFSGHQDALLNRAIDQARSKTKRGGVAPSQLVLPDALIHEMRMVKTPGEVTLMRKAAEITGLAHRRAMEVAKPGVHEYEVEAALLSVFRAHGSERPAYGSIVGSGPNATVLHYRENSRQMNDGDLPLIDAGCEFGYYASDVTRTFPVNGRFTEGQRTLYELVLRSQEAAIEAVRPTNTLEDVHNEAVRVLSDGMVSLGLIEGPTEEAIKEERYKTYYMHRTSHWLGMDVHDVGYYYEGHTPRGLEPGFVLTVEPGIYIDEDADVPPAFRGQGIRIEDDILVTESGCENLTEHIPKGPDEIEALLLGRA